MDVRTAEWAGHPRVRDRVRVVAPFFTIVAVPVPATAFGGTSFAPFSVVTNVGGFGVMMSSSSSQATAVALNTIAASRPAEANNARDEVTDESHGKLPVDGWARSARHALASDVRADAPHGADYSPRVRTRE